MEMDGKPFSRFCFYIFLLEIGPGSETGFENGFGICGHMERNYTNGNSMDTVGSQELKPEYRMLTGHHQGF